MTRRDGRVTAWQRLCPTCGKHGFRSKRDAKRAARQRHPGDHLNVYRCGELWHFGHLPRTVLDGDAGRAAIYRGVIYDDLTLLDSVPDPTPEET